MNYLVLDTKKQRLNSRNEKIYGDESDGAVTYNVETKTFITDIHAPFKAIFVGATITIMLNANGKEIKTPRSVHFKITSIDRDASGEDIYGWHGKQVNGKTNAQLFIVND